MVLKKVVRKKDVRKKDVRKKAAAPHCVLFDNLLNQYPSILNSYWTGELVLILDPDQIYNSPLFLEYARVFIPYYYCDNIFEMII